MGLRASASKTTNKKEFDKNFDRIFRKNKKRRNNYIEVEENVKTKLHGRVKRYHYIPKDTTVKGKAPAIIQKKSTIEKSMESL